MSDHYDSIWDDKRFVLTIAISITGTFIFCVVLTAVICSVYHKRFFGEHRVTSNDLGKDKEIYKARKPTTLGEYLNLIE